MAANETRRNCANWVAEDKRRILLVNFQPIEKLSWMAEEYHMSLSLVKSCLKLGFDIHHVDKSYFENYMDPGELSSYHRILYMLSSPSDVHWSHQFDHRDVICKIRVLLPDGKIWNDTDFLRLSLRFQKKQLLVASPHEDGTYFGYYPVLSTGVAARPVSSMREKRGIIVLSPHLKVSETANEVMKKLIDAGLIIHVICSGRLDVKVELPNSAIRHQDLSQEETSRLLSQSAFLIHFGDTVATPLPVIAISFGVSVINLSSKDGTSQMPSLSEMGMPYVYNVDIDDEDAIVSTAQLSVQYRFASHVMVTDGVMEDRVCALVEDDSMCSCPSQMSGMECRASFYMKKEAIFPAVE